MATEQTNTPAPPEGSGATPVPDLSQRLHDARRLLYLYDYLTERESDRMVQRLVRDGHHEYGAYAEVRHG